MADIPNLVGIAHAELVEKIGGGNFSASYINWARTMNLLRQHAPGWMPELVPTAECGILHRAPAGGFLLIRFRHSDGTVTPEVPQAVMDSRNNAVAFDKITARDITDTHRRGFCMAAALTFGLASELWAKMPLESGFPAEDDDAAAKSVTQIKPTDGVWEAQSEESQAFLQKIADAVMDIMPDAKEAMSYIESQNLETDEKAALWTRLDSKTRAALKAAHKEAA
ncbi:MAG: hypothetical protein QM612_08490 [Thermomonas sp.]|uniref:hypothetical protein n=1 Tax=Thermomonas sp. TaxID=1971895 RepID=UPI0039E4A107